MSTKKAVPEKFNYDAYAWQRRIELFDWETGFADEMEDLSYKFSVELDGFRGSWGYYFYPCGARDAVPVHEDKKLAGFLNRKTVSPIGDFVADIAENMRDILNLSEEDTLPSLKVTATYPQAVLWKKSKGVFNDKEGPSFSMSVENHLSPGQRARKIAKMKDALNYFEKSSEEFSSKIISLTPDVPEEILETSPSHTGGYRIN